MRLVSVNGNKKMRLEFVVGVNDIKLKFFREREIERVNFLLKEIVFWKNLF